MNHKRQTLIDTALTLFYENGVHSIGINEILKVSGIAKKTLYHHFSGKEALVLAALEERNHRFINWLTSRLTGVKDDNEVIDALFYALTDWFNNGVTELGDFRGCFFINTSAEFSEPNSEISQYCQQHKQDVRNLIREHLINKNDTLLEAICLLKEGAISNAYVSNDVDAANKAGQIMKALEFKNG